MDGVRMLPIYKVTTSYPVTLFSVRHVQSLRILLSKRPYGYLGFAGQNGGWVLTRRRALTGEYSMSGLCVSTENVATLFRASTLSTMLMDQFMKLTASEYLEGVLREPIRQIADSVESCEVMGWSTRGLCSVLELVMDTSEVKMEIQDIPFTDHKKQLK